MAARIRYELRCDVPDCGAVFLSERDRATAARRVAEGEGWRHALAPRLHGPWASLDYCPEHAAEADAPTLAKAPTAEEVEHG